jgi:hypothetical protein
MGWFNGKAYKGPDGEESMTDDDWQARGHDQAMAMREGGNAFDSSPDNDGDPTGGDYNGDYPDSYHDALNQRLDDDESFAREVENNVRSLLRADTNRRANEDS